MVTLAMEGRKRWRRYYRCRGKAKKKKKFIW